MPGDCCELSVSLRCLTKASCCRDARKCDCPFTFFVKSGVTDRLFVRRTMAWPSIDA